MRPLIIRLTVALITLFIGITSFWIFRSRRPEEPRPLAQMVEIPVKPQPQQSPVLPPEVKPQEESDLSIVVKEHVDSFPPSFEVRHIKLGKNRKAVIDDFDLSKTIDGQEVTLNFPDSSASYRVLQRYRTSMSISLEGPHLDLVDWRHFDSPWIPLKSLGAKRFQTLRSDQMDDSRFPTTTKAEILNEVRRRVENDSPELLEWVESCNGPNNGACIVAISSIYLRIQKQVGNGWTDVGLVEVQLPMGC